MKRVRFNEETQTFTPVMQGHMHCIKKEPLSAEEDVQQRRSPFQTKRQRQRDMLRHSHALRKAGYSDVKRRKKKSAWTAPTPRGHHPRTQTLTLLLLLLLLKIEKLFFIYKKM